MNKRHLTVRVNLRSVDLTAFLNKANALIDKEVKYDHDSVHLKWAGQFENHIVRMPVWGCGSFGVGTDAASVVCGLVNSGRRSMMSVVPLALFGGMLALNAGTTLNVSRRLALLPGLRRYPNGDWRFHINNLRTRNEI